MRPTVLTENHLQWDEAWQAVVDAQRILIVTHIKPDGDAIGSLLGLGNALVGLNKQVDLAVDEGVPGFLEFLPNSNRVLPKLTLGAWDLLISVDSSDEERTGSVGAFGRAHSKRVINLDHHVTNLLFGDIPLVKIDAVSATEVVFLLLMQKAPQTLNRNVALPLLTGLLTDTIGFRTSNVNVETLHIAMQLMAHDVTLTEVTAQALEVNTFDTIKLWGYSLASAQIINGVVFAQVTQEDLRRAGHRDVSDAGLVGLLRTIDEAMIAVVFVELESKDKVKVSFRSKKGFDVGSVALALGGGGHIQASGATLQGNLEESQARVLPMLYKVAQEGKLVIE